MKTENDTDKLFKNDTLTGMKQTETQHETSCSDPTSPPENRKGNEIRSNTSQKYRTKFKNRGHISIELFFSKFI